MTKLGKLQIRNIPDDIHQILKRIALDERISLNTLLLNILSEAVGESKYGKEEGK